jgi:chromosome segregation ATPase
MIEARERAYAERTPRVDALLGSDVLDALAARRKQVEGRVNDVVIMEDVAALGTMEQRAQWQRVAEIEAGLAVEPDNDETAAKRERLRLVKGVLYWDLRQSYRDRLFQQRGELKSLDAALTEANNRWLRVQQARQSAPTTTGDFAARIDALQARMTSLHAKLGDAAKAQGDLLADIAVAELDAQKQRLADYEIQARFALATIYDRAADAPRPAPAAGQGTP